MIVKSEQADFEEILVIINDGASAYRGIIPADRWHEPYMTAAELKGQIDDGVQFWTYNSYFRFMYTDLVSKIKV